MTDVENVCQRVVMWQHEGSRERRLGDTRTAQGYVTHKAGVVAHTCGSRTWKAETGATCSSSSASTKWHAGDHPKLPESLF